MNKNVYLILFFISLFFFSCETKKRIVYFQGEEEFKKTIESYTPILKADDYISIIVTSDQPETAEPFNYPKQEFGRQNMMMGGGMQLGMPVMNAYLIDEEGYIELPIIGRIKAEGLTRKELRDHLIPIYKKYIDNPILNINLKSANKYNEE